MIFFYISLKSQTHKKDQRPYFMNYEALTMTLKYEKKSYIKYIYLYI